MAGARDKKYLRKRRGSCALAYWLLCFCGQATGEIPPEKFLDEQVQYICESLSAGQATDYPAHFSPEFLNAVSATAFASILAQLKKRYGVCTGWRYSEKTGDFAVRILTEHQTARQLRFDLAVDPHSGLITGLMALGATKTHNKAASND